MRFSDTWRPLPARPSVCLSVLRLSDRLLTFHIFDIYAIKTEPIPNLAQFTVKIKELLCQIQPKLAQHNLGLGASS